MTCSADQVIVTAGAQHAVDIAVRVLLKPGDQVWMEDPGYPATRHARDAVSLIPGLDQAWEVEKARAARGDGFRKYVLGADGEPVDVTPIG